MKTKSNQTYQKENSTIYHGFAIHFGLIKAPRGVSVIMVATKGPGHVVRSQYKEGKGVPALIAINKGSSKDSKKIALAWAAGIGAARLYSGNIF